MEAELREVVAMLVAGVTRLANQLLSRLAAHFSVLW